MTEQPRHSPPREVLFSDVAARRRAEVSQRVAEQRFDSVIAGVRDYAIFLLDAGGHVTTWNAGAERFKGYTADEIIGQHFSVFYTADAKATRWPQRELEVAAREGRFEDEGWRVRKDGTRFWAKVVINTLYDPQGEPAGFLKITGDLTDRRLAEEALRESEERFRLMVETIRDYAIFRLDPDGRVATWNAGAERIKGYRPNEIIGRHFSVFYDEESKARRWPERELEAAARDGRFEDEGWRVRKDGTQFWANVVITALRDAHGKLVGYAKVTRDLTERKLAEETLREAHADLEQRVQERTRELEQVNTALRNEVEERRRLQEARERLEQLLRQRLADLAEVDRHKNEFLAMLGHELRNPLAPIRNALEILKLRGVGGDVHQRARETIDRQVQHLVRLVDDLLDVSRIMQGKIELRHGRFDLATMVGRAIETAQPAIDAHGHQLVVSLPPDRVELEGDVIRLSQVVANLLVNAAKYTERAGRVELSAAVEGQRLLLRVRDNGIGIPAELLPRLFDFFVQGSRSLARSQGGLGIGLTLVKRISEMHGGTVSAASDGPGKGSELTVDLPLPPQSPAAGVALATGAAPVEQTRRRMLVVDDNVDAAESTAALLALWGHDVRIAHDGNAALAAAREQQPDVVLLDIGLPDQDGYAVARQLRLDTTLRQPLLVAMTGYGQDEDRRRAADAGFDVHFTKPLDLERLRELLDGAGD